MRLKDIEVGKTYAAVWYYRPDQHGRTVVEARDWDHGQWDKLWRDLYPVLVLEKPVVVGHYSTPGVLVRRLDPQTGERQRWQHNDKLADDNSVRAVSLLMPWDDWTDLYLSRMQSAEDAAAVRAEERDREKARRQEQAARDWMQRAFDDARETFEEMVALGHLNGFVDEDVRALVEHRNPNGNPYLNGERQAMY